MTCREEETQLANRLWAEYARTGDPRTRDALIRQFERLAYSIANRFARRGQENEDLFQAAMVGLVKAVDRFDPASPHRFSTFATPTILGEIKRHFRDHTWKVHVPRGMQELAQEVERTAGAMTERLGRHPTAREIAARLELPEERVLEALSLEETNRPLSLDGEIGSDTAEGPTVLEDSLGAEDPALIECERRVSMNQAVGRLDGRLRQIIELRYSQELSQREVGRRLGLPQMQVSRLERRALSQLRRLFAVH